MPQCRTGTEGRGYVCCVCDKLISGNCPSVKCNKCDKWCHLRKSNNCSKIGRSKKETNAFICEKCDNKPCDRNPNGISSQPTSQPAPSPPPPPPPPPRPNPRPPPDPIHERSFDLKILQFNCNGLKGKLDQVIDMMEKNNLKIAALQETKFTNKSKIPDIPDYALVRSDRGKDNKGGGLAFLVHTTVLFEPLLNFPKDKHIEALGIKVSGNSLINIYIPPVSSCSAGYVPDITPYLPTSDGYLYGDINAHDPLWHSSIQDARGTLLSQVIGDSDLGVLNTDTPTRLPSNGQPTSPDISLASPSLLP